jgi:glucose-1-phosphate cytidylyltransferase
MLTYGDGVADIDLNKLLEFHRKSGRLCTLTAVRSESSFGVLNIEDNATVSSFREKPKSDDTWINGGFFVCEAGVFGYIPDGDDVVWEQKPLCDLAQAGQLGAFKHHGFWHPMDTLKDKESLDKTWDSGRALWKVWG